MNVYHNFFSGLLLCTALSLYPMGEIELPEYIIKSNVNIDELPEGIKRCTVCCERLKKDITHTTCDHYFHASCLGQWFSTEDGSDMGCPKCDEKLCIELALRGVSTESAS